MVDTTTTFHSMLIRPKIQRKKRKPRKSMYADKLPYIESLFRSKKLEYLTLHSIRESLNNIPKVPSISWISYSLKKLHISRRRFTNTKVCSRDNESLMQLYKEFKEKINSLQDDQIVCIDETGFSNLGNTVYGYFPRGMIPETRAFHKREKFSVLMTVHPKIGICCHTKQKQAYNKISFLAFLQDTMIPSLPSYANG